MAARARSLTGTWGSLATSEDLIRDDSNDWPKDCTFIDFFGCARVCFFDGILDIVGGVSCALSAAYQRSSIAESILDVVHDACGGR